jgi:branched-chain amino acid aminotransferase
MENIKWEELGFGYIRTDYNIRSTWKDGKWSEPRLCSDENVTIHMASTALHYGQTAFEGAKAFMGADGKVRLFRIDENARRMQSSAEYLMMAVPPIELFVKMTEEVVRANARFIPPYGSGASLYIRPFLFGAGANVGVKPADQYEFIIFVTPVGPYFKAGFQPIQAIIDRDHDRAAPLGTGHIKAGGNYGASLLSGDICHRKGYQSAIYLDAAHKQYIDEAGAANFFGIKNNTYVTPKSHSVLPSITNMSLRDLASDLGLKVEERLVDYRELAEFEEAGACGTAAVISPIGEVYDPQDDRHYIFGDGKSAGPVSTKLYNLLRGIQLGDEPDTHGWVTFVEL